MARTRKFIKGGTLTKKEAATKLQSFNRGKTTRKHTKRLQLYKKLPDDLQSIINKKYKSIPVLKRMNTQLLLDGAKEGNLEKVKYALDNYAEIEAKHRWGYTALITASINGHFNVVKKLLEKGADVNAQDNYYNTALMWASIRNRTDIVKILLDAGAKTEIKDERGIMVGEPLHQASHSGNIEVVKLLLRYGADINSEVKWADGPLLEDIKIYSENLNGDEGLNDEDEKIRDNLPIVIKLLEKAQQKKLRQSTPKYQERRKKVKQTRKRREGKGKKTRRH